MIRRQRIKVAANINVARRSSNKNSDEILKSNNEKGEGINESVESQNDDRTDVSSACQSNVEVSESACITDVVENIGSVSENVDESNPAVAVPEQRDSGFVSPVNMSDITFKTPMNLSRNESESSNQTANSQKFRKFKLAPRLSSRSITKPQHDNDDVKNIDENQIEKEENAVVASQSSVTPSMPQIAPESEIQKRPELPQEQSNVIVNHNIAYPSLSQSPFPYHGSRIRTESLCSIKSTREYTVANLHPRKMFREDQKLLDIKRESRERLSKKDVDKSKLKMFDMIYFNPQNNPMKPRPTIKVEKPKIDLKKEMSPPPAVDKDGTMPVPRLKLNASGEMVLDETSLVVENEQQRQNRILLANNTVVYDDDLSGSYGIYKRQQRTREWQHDETIKFYRCLNTVGTDFSMMLSLFPNRSRRDLKLKFKKEEKNNPDLVDKALLKHNVFDLDELQRDFDQEEAEKCKKREESSKSEVKEHLKRKILKNQEAKLKAEERSRSKIQKILSDGDLALQMAEENLAKENLESKKKRKYTKKPKDEGATQALMQQQQSPNDGLQMFAGFPGISETTPADKKRVRKRKIDDGSEKTINNSKNEKCAIRPIIITEPRKFDHENTVKNRSNFVKHQPVENPTFVMEQQIEVEKFCDLSSAPIEIQSDNNILNSPEFIIDSHNQQGENLICFDDFQSEASGAFEKSPDKKHTISVEKSIPDNFFYEISVNGNEWEENITTDTSDYQILTFDTQPAITTTTDEITKCQNVPITQPQKSPEKPKTKLKSKKQKYKPTNFKSMRLDANGEMVPNEIEDEKNTVDENLNVTKIDDVQPSTSNHQSEEMSDTNEDFDLEAFVRSLDFDNLVVVEAHKNGKDFYEIHKSDPNTQEILDEPLNLPQKYVDLIVKLMTQPDDDEDDD